MVADWAFVPGGGLFVGVCQAEHYILAPLGSGDLQADGKPRLRETARNGNRRQSPDVEGASVAQELQLGGPQRLGRGLQFFDRRSRNRGGGSNQHIDPGEYLGDAAPEMFELTTAVDVIGGGDIFSGANA